MKALSSDLRALLDSAARADSMPTALRQRERRRLMQAVAAGTITTSAALAEAALLGASKASLAVSAGTHTAGSLTATLLSAVVIGVSSGLVAVSPASRTTEPPQSHAQTRAQMQSHTQMRKQAQRSLLGPTEDSRPQVVDRFAPVALPPTASAIERTRPMSVATAAVGAAVVPPIASTRDVPGADGSEAEVPPTIESPNARAAASITRETELLAQVQRALKSHRALLALATLDRYAEECPEQILAEEATASRVVALCALGRHADGRRWAEQFVRRFPNSPLISRVLGACPKLAICAGGGDSKP